jgi:hypothetical protein
MYKLISPSLIKDLFKEIGGDEMVVEVFGMLKDEYNNRIVLIEEAIKNNDFIRIKESVHPLKSNLNYFVEKKSEFGLMIQDFEDKGAKGKEIQDPEMKRLYASEMKFDQLFQHFKMKCHETFAEIEDYTKSF